MALINCQECGKEISDQAVSCPNCGHPQRAAEPAPITTHEKKTNTGCAIASAVGVCLILVVLLALCGKSGPETVDKGNKQGNLAKMVNPQTNEGMATLINLNGCLCAKVTSVRNMSGAIYYVDCVEYRNGSGEVTYRVDLDTGTVSKR
ncbi:MAG: zinc-ribbon domain-containing protein [Humidesulfovibrio sp.]